MCAPIRSLLRKQWLGVAALCVFSYLWTSNQPGFRGEWLTLWAYLVFLAIFVFAALRYGFLAMVVASCASQVMYQSILTRDLGAWYGRSSAVAVLLVSALAIWAARVLVRQRPLPT